MAPTAIEIFNYDRYGNYDDNDYKQIAKEDPQKDTETRDILLRTAIRSQQTLQETRHQIKKAAWTIILVALMTIVGVLIILIAALNTGVRVIENGETQNGVNVATTSGNFTFVANRSDHRTRHTTHHTTVNAVPTLKSTTAPKSSTSKSSSKSATSAKSSSKFTSTKPSTTSTTKTSTTTTLPPKPTTTQVKAPTVGDVSSPDTFTSTFDLKGHNDWVYLGCYQDNPNSRTFRIQTDPGIPMTNAVCQDSCTSKSIYAPAYAATEWSVECYCSSTPPTTGLSQNCNMPCPGNASETCGGSRSMSVYYRKSISTQSVVGPPGWFSLHIKDVLPGVTPAQAERIIAMTGGIGEHAAVDFWNYMSACADNGDGNGYTMSLGGFTTAWGDVYDMFKRMLDNYPDYWLAKKWLPYLVPGGNGYYNTAGLDGFCNDVKSVGNNDPIFNFGVWSEVNSSAWYPAHKHCTSRNMTSALCQFIVYDSNLGLSHDMVDLNCDIGVWSKSAADELNLMTQHMNCKENLYKQQGNFDPSSSYTMSSWQRSLINAKNLDLNPPLFVKVYEDFLINF